MPGYRKLGRTSAHRKAMLRNLVTDLLREGRSVVICMPEDRFLHMYMMKL